MVRWWEVGMLRRKSAVRVVGCELRPWAKGRAHGARACSGATR